VYTLHRTFQWGSLFWPTSWKWDPWRFFWDFNIFIQSQCFVRVLQAISYLRCVDVGDGTPSSAFVKRELKLFIYGRFATCRTSRALFFVFSLFQNYFDCPSRHSVNLCHPFLPLFLNFFEECYRSHFIFTPVFLFIIFFIFRNLFAICIDTFKYNQQMVCWEAEGGYITYVCYSSSALWCFVALIGANRWIAVNAEVARQYQTCPLLQWHRLYWLKGPIGRLNCSLQQGSACWALTARSAPKTAKASFFLYRLMCDLHYPPISVVLEALYIANVVLRRLPDMCTLPCKKKKLNSMVWVREQTKPSERPPLVGEVTANFCG
jgi:hypothetical protein